MSDEENIDAFLSENSEPQIPASENQINTTLETSTPDASTTASGVLMTTDQMLLQSAKLEGKIRGDTARTLFQNQRDSLKDSRSGLFGPSFRGNIDHIDSTLSSSDKINFTPRYISGASWGSNLSKIKVPVLKNILGEQIVQFQTQYKKYLREVHELEERYGTQISVRSVFFCLTPKALHYLCYMSKLIPKEKRQPPNKIDRGYIHSIIMDYRPRGRANNAIQLYEELNQIRISMMPNGLLSICEAWGKLFDLENKYPTVQLKPKKVIKILAKNITPKETSQSILISMETGDQEHQKMGNDLGLFHDYLVKIAESIQLVSSLNALLTGKQKSNTEASGLTITPGRQRTRNKKEKSAAAKREGGCKNHGPNCTHGTSECWLEHPELAPDYWDYDKAMAKHKEWKRKQQNKGERSNYLD